MKLRDIRVSVDMTQVEVATKLLVPQSSVSQWEAGDNYPHPEKIPKLAQLYGVTSDDIIAAIREAKAEKPRAG